MSVRAFALAVACLGGTPFFTPASAFEEPPLNFETTPESSEPIPWSEIGGAAGAKYEGDGLSIVPTEDGALLRSVFQKLEAEATSEGLWLSSTVPDAANDRFRVVATAAGDASIPLQGQVAIEGEIVRFIRSGLVEEYSVSADGVRQDFLVPEKPMGDGELRVELAVNGARAETSSYGARLMLDNSGRKVAYSRLFVVDAAGRELPARMEVTSPHSISVLVDDIDAIYPVRIDPTFSDENWISMGIALSNSVHALAVLNNDLYVGGDFTSAGGNPANYIAKWDGSTWSALGSGMNNAVRALTVLDNDLYVGGNFTSAGGNPANYIARWNGTTWAPLSSGMNNPVWALAVLDNDLYAGGVFWVAGGNSTRFIAKWDGITWSALGSGMNNVVRALTFLDNDLYVGGNFTSAGGNPANYIAKWDGTTWSALGSGMSSQVWALAVLDNGLYAGGLFTSAGEKRVNRIAKWDGSAWSALGSGMDSQVSALAVHANDLYAGGSFLSAGGNSANRIAKWDGGAWSALGTGTSSHVRALAVHAKYLYAGGDFFYAGLKPSLYIAKAEIAVNSPPLVFNSIPNQDGAYGAEFGYEVNEDTFYDPDGDPLEYTASGLPSWLSFEVLSLTFRGSPTETGDFTITVSATDPDGESVSTAFILSIAPALLTVQADDKAKTYDGMAFLDFTASYSGFVAGEGPSALDGDPVFGGNALGAVDAGEYTITVSGLSSGNYEIVFQPGTLVIEKAHLTITANDKSKTYGEALTFAGTEFTTIGLVAPDIINTVSLTSAGAAETAMVDIYAIVPSAAAGGGLGNYTVSYVEGTLTVNPAPLEVTIHRPASGLLVQVNEPVDLSGSFTLTGVPGTYSALWAFSSATVAEYFVDTDTISGTTVSHQTTFTEPGVYEIELIVIDPTEPGGVIASSNTVEHDLLAYVVAYDPEAGFVTGGGWIDSPAGAVLSELAGVAEAEGRARFAFVSEYKEGATVPAGSFRFRVGNLDFASTTYEWMVVSGPWVQFKGSGRLNGEEAYSFMLTGVDGSQMEGPRHPDRFRIKIWDGVLGEVIYDNMLEADDNDQLNDNAQLDDSTIIGGGNITIHTRSPGQQKK